MNIQERINDLLSKGCSAITFTNGQDGGAMVAATQMMGLNDWHSKTTIEAIGSSHTEALNTLAEKVEHLSKLVPKTTSNILHAPNSN